MRLLIPVIALLTSCSPQRIVEALPTPPDRLVCEAAAARPALSPEFAIDWSKVETVDQAHSLHDAFVRTVRAREGVVAGYLVDIEGRHFLCWRNVQWRREFEAGLAKPTK